MSNGTSVKGNQDNPRLTVSLDEPKCSLRDDVDGNPDLFLAASLQFLHRLLAERTVEYAKIDADGIPRSQVQIGDVQEEEKNTTRQLYFQQIDQIEEYKRQLRSMEKFLSNIQLEADKPIRNANANCDAIGLNETNDASSCREPQNVESTKLYNDPRGFVSHDSSFCASTYLHSFLNPDESHVDISEGSKIDDSRRLEGSAVKNSTLRKTVPYVVNDFTHHRKTRSWTSLRNNGIQSSASYADIVRNAVSGLARNCGKKKSRRKKKSGNRWRAETGIMESPKEERYQGGYPSKVESEISSESKVRDERGSDIPKEVPLRVQLAMETDASPRKPVTLLVRVPNTVFNLLNRKISDRDTKISSTEPSMETHTEPGKRRKRITSVFRNFLKGRRTPSSSTVYSAEEKLSSHLTLALKETGNDAVDRTDASSRNPLLYRLRRSASCDFFERRKSAELSFEANNESIIEPGNNLGHASFKYMFVPPAKNVNEYEKISLSLSPRVMSYETKPRNEKAAGTTWRKLTDDKTLRTEVPSNKIGILKGLTNYHDEKIIPLRCSEGSPQLGKKRGEITRRDVDMFLKLAAEMRKPQVYRNANDKHVEIPVEIKTTETPLRLRKAQNFAEGFSDHRVFYAETKSSQATPNAIETQEFLEMLVGTLPEGAYPPQNKYCESQELSLFLDSVENEPQDKFQLIKNSEDSALEVLLRHIATDTSMKSCTKPYAAEKDTTVQTVPKRQLSKISICCSSESLSGSDHENPEVRMKNSTFNQDEYKVHNHLLSSEPIKLDNRRYFHHYEPAEQNYTCNCVGNEVENSNPNLSLFDIQDRRKLATCTRTTEVIIEEQNCVSIEAEIKPQVVMDIDRKSLPIRETENTIFCHPVLSRQIFGDRKELADAMIRWWGPQINYSTTPSSQTQLSAYSVSINNLM